MSEPIVSITQVKEQARQAAEQYSDVNDACPYPFYTQAGQMFKQFFERARIARLEQEAP